MDKTKCYERNYGYNILKKSAVALVEYSWSKEAKSKKGKKVINLSDGLIFYSIKEANEYYNIGKSHISLVCNGKMKTCNGDLWSWADENNKPVSKENNRKCCKSSVINLTDGKIFKSIKEASAFYNISKYGIGRVCAGKQEYFKGYKWAYINGHKIIYPKYVSKERLKPENHYRQRKVVNLDTGKIFKSLTQAGLFYNIDGCLISEVCRGKNILAGGYRWRYIDNNNKIKNIVRENKVKKRVINLDTDEIFESISEASRAYNVKPSNISKVCSGKRKLSAGCR